MRWPAPIRLARAKPEQADELTRIAVASKRHWKYPDEWIEAWRPQLSLSSEYIESNEVYLAETSGRIVGFFALEIGKAAKLEHLWVAQDLIGRGLGEILFRHARELARNLGHRALEIECDPNAEGFYLKLGARRVGTIAGHVLGIARETPRLRAEI